MKRHTITIDLPDNTSLAQELRLLNSAFHQIHTYLQDEAQLCNYLPSGNTTAQGELPYLGAWRLTHHRDHQQGRPLA